MRVNAGYINPTRGTASKLSQSYVILEEEEEEEKKRKKKEEEKKKKKKKEEKKEQFLHTYGTYLTDCILKGGVKNF